MGLFDRLGNILKGDEELDENYEEEAYEEEEQEQAEPAPSQSQAQTQAQTQSQNSAPRASSGARSTGGVSSGSALNMKVVKPEGANEAKAIADLLLEGCTVVLNLEQTNKETAKRIVEFLSGVVHAIKGDINKVANSTYVVTPKNVAVQNGEATSSDDDSADQPRDIFR